MSLALFVLALRQIGTARTGAYFCVAPFAGAVISILLLGEELTVSAVVAAVLLGLGVWLHVTERHKHLHRHEPTEYVHLPSRTCPKGWRCGNLRSGKTGNGREGVCLAGGSAGAQTGDNN